MVSDDFVSDGRLEAAESLATAADRKSAIDIERLVWWALNSGRGLPWRADPALSFDKGCTAKPRAVPRGNWALVLAGAKSGGRIRRVVLQPQWDDDAAVVLAAIRALPSSAAALVVKHGRAGTRPELVERIERLVPQWYAPGRPTIRHAQNRGRQPYCLLVVETELRPAIRDYALWLEALRGLRLALANRLCRWLPRGPAAPEC